MVRDPRGDSRRLNANAHNGDEDSQASQTILINCSNKELNPQNGFRFLTKRLKQHYKVDINQKDELSSERLRGVGLVVFGAPEERFEASEIDTLKAFLHSGGSVLLLASEGGGAGGEHLSNKWMNGLTAEFGIRINDDVVVRSVYSKDYFHPKEAYIKSASLSQTLSHAAHPTNRQHDSTLDDDALPPVSIVYPFGATLDVRRPAVPLLSSGELCVPAKRTLAAIARVSRDSLQKSSSNKDARRAHGSLVVCGSVGMFDDTYLAKEDNSNALLALVKYCLDGLPLDRIDEDAPELGPMQTVPDTASLAERLRVCLQEREELPADFTQLFDQSLFKFDSNHIPEVAALFKELNVVKKPLSLIPPEFEVPLPSLQPAVFLPPMRELPPPSLELFDLDQEFASQKSRMAQLTNKCDNSNLDYFVREAGEILGIADEIDADGHTDKTNQAKRVLEYALKHLFRAKLQDKLASSNAADQHFPEDNYHPEEDHHHNDDDEDQLQLGDEDSREGFQAQADERESFEEEQQDQWQQQ